jgi:tRNA 2-thiouridine synthesizing protein D
MQFGILVNEGPYSHQASDSAYLFARTAIEKGYKVPRVFFYHDGVYNSSRLATPPQDDRNVAARWSKLAADHGVDLVASRTVCWATISASRVWASWWKWVFSTIVS